MKNHFEKIHSCGTNQHCDRCDKPNIFGEDVKNHIDSHKDIRFLKAGAQVIIDIIKCGKCGP